jgi:hypothetical protein
VQEGRSLLVTGLGVPGSVHLLTQAGDGSGFRVVVLPSLPGAVPAGLAVNRGIDDQTLMAAGGVAQFSVPADAFAHSDPNAEVRLSARLANGDPLPEWLVFDPVSGRFVLRTAPGERKVLEVRVEARDGSNVVVYTTFKIQLTPAQPAAPLSERSGRSGLSAQLRQAAQRPPLALERARVPAVNTATATAVAATPRT